MRNRGNGSGREYSYEYFFNNVGVKKRVCRAFFLATLTISATRITYFYNNYQTEFNVPKERSQGKNQKKFTPEADKKAVRAHIRSLPHVDSHYCRCDSTREYLEEKMSMPLLYQKYVVFLYRKGSQYRK